MSVQNPLIRPLVGTAAAAPAARVEARHAEGSGFAQMLAGQTPPSSRAAFDVRAPARESAPAAAREAPRQRKLEDESPKEAPAETADKEPAQTDPRPIARGNASAARDEQRLREQRVQDHRVKDQRAARHGAAPSGSRVSGGQDGAAEAPGKLKSGGDTASSTQAANDDTLAGWYRSQAAKRAGGELDLSAAGLSGAVTRQVSAELASESDTVAGSTDATEGHEVQEGAALTGAAAQAVLDAQGMPATMAWMQSMQAPQRPSTPGGETSAGASRDPARGKSPQAGEERRVGAPGEGNNGATATARTPEVSTQRESTRSPADTAVPGAFAALRDAAVQAAGSGAAGESERAKDLKASEAFSGPAVGNAYAWASGGEQRLNAAASTAPVAVVQVPTPIDEAGFADSVSLRVVNLARSGAEVATLQMNPPEMGPVEVSIQLAGDQARVGFTAEREETRAALQASIETLDRSFRAEGLVLVDARVEAAPEASGMHDAPSDSGSQLGAGAGSGEDPAQPRQSQGASGQGEGSPQGRDRAAWAEARSAVREWDLRVRTDDGQVIGSTPRARPAGRLDLYA